MNAYRWCIRPILLAFDAETIHQVTLRLCYMLDRSQAARREVEAAYAFDARVTLHCRSLVLL